MEEHTANSSVVQLGAQHTAYAPVITCVAVTNQTTVAVAIVATLNASIRVERLGRGVQESE